LEEKRDFSWGGAGVVQRIILKSKIHMARVNKKVLDYEGSIEIDEELMELAGLVEGEKVLVANMDNGERFETYVIRGKRGSRVIGLNGASARLAEIGDRLIIMAFGIFEEGEKVEPRIVVLDEENRVVRR